MPRAPKCSAAAKALAGEVADDGVLEAGDEVEGFGVEDVARAAASAAGFAGLAVARPARGVRLRGRRCAGFMSWSFDVAADGGLDAAEGEVEAGRSSSLASAASRESLGAVLPVAFCLIWAKGKGTASGVAVGGERVHPRAAGVGQAEQLGDLVVGFAGGVVEGLADVAVVPGLLRRAGGEIQVRVAAADHQREQRQRRPAKASRSASIRTAWMWPSRWLTPISGRPCRGREPWRT